MLPARSFPSRLRGIARLLVDGTSGITDVVERVHGTIQGLAPPVGRKGAQRTRGPTAFVYRNVRSMIRLVGEVADSSLGAAASAATTPATTPATYQVVLNGIFGDYLAQTASPLAIPIGLRGPTGDVVLQHPQRNLDAHRWMHECDTGRVVLLIHGLCMSDSGWNRKGYDLGVAIAQDDAFLPLYLRYNSGLAVANNGAQLAALLDALMAQWPTSIRELAIVGYSMGGLVARSAVHQALAANMRWTKKVSQMIFLGTPHHGSPLELAGSFVDRALGISAYSRPFARITQARSAGIHDLRRGRVCRDDGHVALPQGIDSYAIAATTTTDASRARLRGDGLVPVDSALGRHRDPLRDLAIPDNRQWIAYGLGHFDLLSHPRVGAKVREWLGGSC
ncbi:MAG: alpha/beta hydrolase [Pseudomonadota bacterium]